MSLDIGAMTQVFLAIGSGNNEQIKQAEFFLEQVSNIFCCLMGLEPNPPRLFPVPFKFDLLWRREPLSSAPSEHPTQKRGQRSLESFPWGSDSSNQPRRQEPPQREHCACHYFLHRHQISGPASKGSSLYHCSFGHPKRMAELTWDSGRENQKCQQVFRVFRGFGLHPDCVF